MTLMTLVTQKNRLILKLMKEVAFEQQRRFSYRHARVEAGACEPPTWSEGGLLQGIHAANQAFGLPACLIVNGRG